MAKIHLRLNYKSDGMLRVQLEDSDGDVVTGASGTYDLEDSGGGSIQNGSMSEEGLGWYFFQLADTLAVSPGDILLAKVTMISAPYQCYGEYEIFVETDRR